MFKKVFGSCALILIIALPLIAQLIGFNMCLSKDSAEETVRLVTGVSNSEVVYVVLRNGEKYELKDIEIQPGDLIYMAVTPEIYDGNVKRLLAGTTNQSSNYISAGWHSTLLLQGAADINAADAKNSPTSALYNNKLSAETKCYHKDVKDLFDTTILYDHPEAKWAFPNHEGLVVRVRFRKPTATEMKALHKLETTSGVVEYDVDVFITGEYMQEERFVQTISGQISIPTSPEVLPTDSNTNANNVPDTGNNANVNPGTGR